MPRVGKGGVNFVRHGVLTLAERCKSTSSGVAATLGVVRHDLYFVSARVKAAAGKINGKDLYREFKHLELAKALDAKDWESFVEVFSPSNPDRGTPAGVALAILERKMNLKRSTLKTYASKAKKKT